MAEQTEDTWHQRWTNFRSSIIDQLNGLLAAELRDEGQISFLEAELRRLQDEDENAFETSSYPFLLESSADVDFASNHQVSSVEQQPETAAIETSADETKVYSGPNVCEICTLEQIEIAISCGHCCCASCFKKFTTCPFCRAQILNSIRIFLPS